MLKLISLYRFRHWLKDNSTKNRIWICDIDNTFANTWPCIKKRKRFQYFDFYKSIPPIEPSILFFKQQIKPTDAICFISARSVFTFWVTSNWLLNLNLIYSTNQLTLVSSTHHKLAFIEMAIDMGFEVIVMDDLSFNHENGEVLFYNDVIEKIKMLEVKYFDYDYILKLQEKF